MFVFMVAGSEGLQSATEQKFKYRTGSNSKICFFVVSNFVITVNIWLSSGMDVP